VTKSHKKFVCISVALITSALFGSPLAAIYVTLSPKELAPYLLFPQKISNSYKDIYLKPFGAAGEKVTIPVTTGGHLAGFYFSRPSAPYTVLISHGQGQMSNQIGLAHAALASNLNVLIYDYQGYGESSGTPSTANVLSDGIAAFDYLVHKKKLKPNQIIAMGSSMGTGIAANTAVNRDCAAVLLVAPYASLAQAACDNLSFFKIYPSFLFPQPDLTCLPLMACKNQPVVIIHGALDKKIPVAHSRQLAATYKLNHQPKDQSLGRSDKPVKDNSNFRYVELANCDHGNITLNTITEELNGLVTRLETSKKTNYPASLHASQSASGPLPLSLSRLAQLTYSNTSARP
jgi:uncharacterized protein